MSVDSSTNSGTAPLKGVGVAEKAASLSSSDVDRAEGSLEQNDKHSKNLYKRFNYYMEKLSGESNGIKRIPENERHDDSFWDTATMWVGANTVIAAYALGMFGMQIGMEVADSIATIICFCFLGTLPVAALSTFGPPTGMRQMILSRYWFGSYGARICAFINALTCIGWSSVNTVAAVNTLHHVNYKVRTIPYPVAIVVIAIVSMIIAILGYKFVHKFERYAYIPNVMVFFVICICLGQDHLMDWGEMGFGSSEAASVLTFGGAVYGFAAGWGPYASDYTCYKPKDTNRFKVFAMILFWGTLSCSCPMIIGAFSYQRTVTSPAYLEAYKEYNVGGLLWMILVEDKLHGFGQVCMVILSLSTIANNVPNIYTFSISARAVLPWFEYIPGYMWNMVITGASIGIGIPAYHSFYEYLQDFMDIIAYWISFYYGIVFAEHLWFRRSYDNYNIDAYSSYVRMHLGLAAIFAGCCGVAGAAVGMSQTWYIGPIGKMIAGGGDIGYLLSFGFAFVGLTITRWLERWIFPDESYVFGTDNAWWRLRGLIKTKHLVTPEWARKYDNRYWWAAKTGQAPPGEGGPAEGAYMHDVNQYQGNFARNRGLEEGI